MKQLLLPIIALFALFSSFISSLEDGKVLQQCQSKSQFALAFLDQVSLLPFIEDALKAQGSLQATFFIQESWLNGDDKFTISRVKHLIKQGHGIGLVLPSDFILDMNDKEKARKRIQRLVKNLSKRIDYAVSQVTNANWCIGGMESVDEGKFNEYSQFFQQQLGLQLVLFPARRDVKLRESGDYLLCNVIGRLPGKLYRRVDGDLRPDDSRSLSETLALIQQAKGKIVPLSTCLGMGNMPKTGGGHGDGEGKDDEEKDGDHHDDEEKNGDHHHDEGKDEKESHGKPSNQDAKTGGGIPSKNDKNSGPKSENNHEGVHKIISESAAVDAKVFNLMMIVVAVVFGMFVLL